jgi:hypothetical protein
VLWFLNSIFFSLARSSTLASALSSVLLKASRKSKLLNVCHKSQSRNVPATYPLKVKGKNSTSQVLGILLRAASATAAAVSYASALKKKTAVFIARYKFKTRHHGLFWNSNYPLVNLKI